MRRGLAMPLSTPTADAPGESPASFHASNLLVPLRVRLPLLVALVVTVVVGLSSYLELRVFESSIGADIIETAKATAQAVADDVELRPDPRQQREDLADSLREFIEAVPSIRAISVVVFRGKEAELLASTSSAERPEALTAGREAIATNHLVMTSDTATLRTVAVPARHEERIFGAVVVTFSMASAQALVQSGRRLVLWFVPAAIILLTLLVDLLTRRFIHGPIGRIRRTMQQVKAGTLSARAPIQRNDEIGAVAQGLNEMLEEMEGFNVALQERVREATSELRARNSEILESYQRVFALREALARADQMAAVGHMAASVAHQIGTPLNLISGYVQMLQEEEGPESRVTRRLAIVQEQIAKVTAIVRTLLDHARRPAPKERTDIVQLIERVCDVARPKLDALGVHLELDVERGVPPVLADAVQLELALLNLVSNSLDAMPEGGVTRIAVHSMEPPGVRIEVSDTGTGIAPDLLPRIFEPWFTTKEAGHGTGLGLSITRDVVAGHGGTISARSEVGVGSVMTIDLPAAPAEGPVEAHEAQ